MPRSGRVEYSVCHAGGARGMVFRTTGRQEDETTSNRALWRFAEERRYLPSSCVLPSPVVLSSRRLVVLVVVGRAGREGKNAKAAETQRRMAPLRASCDSRPSPPFIPRERGCLCVRPSLCVPPSPARSAVVCRHALFGQDGGAEVLTRRHEDTKGAIGFVASCEVCGRRGKVGAAEVRHGSNTETQRHGDTKAREPPSAKRLCVSVPLR